MKKVPQTVSSRSIYKNKFVEIKVDEVTLDGNNWEHAYYVKPFKNAAGVVAINETGLYLLDQFRYPSQKFFWQIPMGMMENDADPLETAKRELHEEAGITAKKYTSIGSLYGEPGMSNQEVFIFVGEDLTCGKQHTEMNEVGMKLKHFTFEEVDKLIKDGKIQCGFTLSALLLFKSNFQNQ
jgi:8-oxo-dGTP pyrophosphatase MutT (NUDIX family)